MSASSDTPSLPARLIAAWRRHPVLGTLFPLALLVTVYFAVQSLTHAIYWSDPAHRDEALAGWMTPRYVAHSWDVPREVMLDVLGDGVMPDTGGRPTLERLARDEGIPLEQLIARIETAIAEYRASAR